MVMAAKEHDIAAAHSLERRVTNGGNVAWTYPGKHAGAVYTEGYAPGALQGGGDVLGVACATLASKRLRTLSPID
jgi:hypothetical protein